VGYIEKDVQLGEILVSPVRVKYEIDDVAHSRVNWLVSLKKRRNFDFAGHLLDIVNSQEKDAANSKRKGFVNKDLEKMIGLIRNILLYQYKMCPNAHYYLKTERSVRVDPFDRMIHVAAPDSIDAVCNIYEMFRSMVYSCGAGGDYAEACRLCSTASDTAMINGFSKNGVFFLHWSNVIVGCVAISANNRRAVDCMSKMISLFLCMSMSLMYSHSFDISHRCLKSPSLLSGIDRGKLVVRR
jgi:hypothetical protein